MIAAGQIVREERGEQLCSNDLANGYTIVVDDSQGQAFGFLGQRGMSFPIVKAYTSDQAWRIAELAIQVHGGYGYTRDYPLEQYARDVKILSIWEGTN